MGAGLSSEPNDVCGTSSSLGAYVSVRQHTSKIRVKRRLWYLLRIRCIRQHTSAYVSIRLNSSPNDV